jgi:hypothetical protein
VISAINFYLSGSLSNKMIKLPENLLFQGLRQGIVFQQLSAPQLAKSKNLNSVFFLEADSTIAV